MQVGRTNLRCWHPVWGHCFVARKDRDVITTWRSITNWLGTEYICKAQPGLKVLMIADTGVRSSVLSQTGMDGHLFYLKLGWMVICSISNWDGRSSVLSQTGMEGHLFYLKLGWTVICSISNWDGWSSVLSQTGMEGHLFTLRLGWKVICSISDWLTNLSWIFYVSLSFKYFLYVCNLLNLYGSCI